MFPLNEPSVHEQVQELILNLIFTMKINIFFLISKLYTRLVLIPLLSCFQFFFSDKHAEGFAKTISYCW